MIAIISFVKKVPPSALRSIAPAALNSVAPLVPVVSVAYSLGQTWIQVYNATSPTKAIVAGFKGIFLNCTPPVIEYPILCAGAIACAGAALATGNPNFVVGAIECCNVIVKKTA